MSLGRALTLRHVFENSHSAAFREQDPPGVSMTAPYVYG
jgi:hypothetical protein